MNELSWNSILSTSGSIDCPVYGQTIPFTITSPFWWLLLRVGVNIHHTLRDILEAKRSCLREFWNWANVLGIYFSLPVKSIVLQVSLSIHPEAFYDHHLRVFGEFVDISIGISRAEMNTLSPVKFDKNHRQCRHVAARSKNPMIWFFSAAFVAFLGKRAGNVIFDNNRQKTMSEIGKRYIVSE